MFIILATGAKFVELNPEGDNLKFGGNLIGQKRRRG
jgi:hypothetical protein